MITRPSSPSGAQAVHQMAGTIVELLSLVVVIHVFVVTPGGWIISVDTPVGTVVIVDVIVPVLSTLLVDVAGGVVMDGSELVSPGGTFVLDELEADEVLELVVVISVPSGTDMVLL